MIIINYNQLLGIPEALCPKYIIPEHFELNKSQKYKKYNTCIKLRLKYNLPDKPRVIDFGISLNIYYSGFWFRIVNSYKIDIRIDRQDINIDYLKEKLKEITDIIEKYYPNLYSGW